MSSRSTYLAQLNHTPCVLSKTPRPTRLYLQALQSAALAFYIQKTSLILPKKSLGRWCMGSYHSGSASTLSPRTLETTGASSAGLLLLPTFFLGRYLATI